MVLRKRSSGLIEPRFLRPDDTPLVRPGWISTRGRPMRHDVSDLRRKAGACRQLAAASETEERRTLWLKRADEWERLAIRAERDGPNVATA
jgi:hypothetical protein